MEQVKECSVLRSPDGVSLKIVPSPLNTASSGDPVKFSVGALDHRAEGAASIHREGVQSFECNLSSRRFSVAEHYQHRRDDPDDTTRSTRIPFGRP